MASKKTEEIKAEEIKAEEIKAEEIKAEEIVTVNLPRKPRNEGNFQYVAVNDRRFQVPCGREVEVPRPVYEALHNAALLREYAEERKEELMGMAKEPISQM